MRRYLGDNLYLVYDLLEFFEPLRVILYREQNFGSVRK